MNRDTCSQCGAELGYSEPDPCQDCQAQNEANEIAGHTYGFPIPYYCVQVR